MINIDRNPRQDVLVRAGLVCAVAFSGWATGGAAAKAEKTYDPAVHGAGVLPDNDVIMRALADELGRSMEHLALGDLPRPYFLQYTAEDRVGLVLEARYGAIVNDREERSRLATSRVRVGSFELDNTNVGGGGGRTSLPLDDDYTAIRHALWRMTDEDYKEAVEVLSRKLAYLRDKTIEDRPHDFTAAEPVVYSEPSAEIVFSRPEWEKNLEKLSARFAEHPAVQDSSVRLFAGAVNQHIANSEGTRLRTADTGVYISISAELQADDGMRLNDGLSYVGLDFDDLPPVEAMLADIDEMATKLATLAQAPTMEQYTGPVLFEASASGKVFESLLSDEICARPTPLGGGGRFAAETLEKKLGRRILPRSFQIVDDPSQKEFEGEMLAGSYDFDDEAVRAQTVRIVEDGILRNLLAGRAPTKKVKGSNGHARSGGWGDPIARIGNLFISDAEGVSREELLETLREAADEEGLEYGLRVESCKSGSGRRIGSPIYAYKVYVADGREELVRGLDFQPVNTRALKRLLAGGKDREAYNSTMGVASSIIAPAVIFEELDLARLDEEHDKLPILPAPALR